MLDPFPYNIWYLTIQTQNGREQAPVAHLVILVLMLQIKILYTCDKTCTKYQNAGKRLYPRIITSLITSSSHSSDKSIVLHCRFFLSTFIFDFQLSDPDLNKIKIFLEGGVSSFLFYSLTGSSSFWLKHVTFPPLHICILQNKCSMHTRIFSYITEVKSGLKSQLFTQSD